MADLRETVLGIFTEVAIIEHLARTRVQRKVEEGAMSPGLNAQQFGILNYFVRNHHGPDSIGGIAWAFQEEEAHTAAKVAELEGEGYLAVDPPGSSDPSAMVSITEAGREAQSNRVDDLAPEFMPLIAEIDIDDLECTARVLREIRLTLDNLPDR